MSGGWKSLALALTVIVALLLLLVKLLSSRRATPLDRDDYTARVLLTNAIYEPGHSQPHPELCPQHGSGLRLLILVASAPNHVEERNAIRQTWGRYTRRARVALAFVLGASPADKRAKLAAEDTLFGDLIIGNSVDSYPNLTLKTLSMLEWADTRCPRAPLVLKTDDDVFVNMPRLLRFVSSPQRTNATRTLWGSLIFHPPKTNRSKRSRYYMSPVQFPAAQLPTFAAGAAYLLTADAVRPILEAAPAEPYVPLEDVFVTGILAPKAGVRRVAVNELYTMSAQPCKKHRAVAHVSYRVAFNLWRQLLDFRKKCQQEIYLL